MKEHIDFLYLILSMIALRHKSFPLSFCPRLKVIKKSSLFAQIFYTCYQIMLTTILWESKCHLVMFFKNERPPNNHRLKHRKTFALFNSFIFMVELETRKFSLASFPARFVCFSCFQFDVPEPVLIFISVIEIITRSITTS